MNPSIPLNSPALRKSLPACLSGPLLVLAAVLLGAQPMAAQALAPLAAHAPPHSSVHPHKRPAHRPGHSASPASSAAPTPLTPPAPELPHWPANDKPGEASITWDSRGLRIDAANSSLQQILKDVSTVTGAKVEGLGADERVFGAYGPGEARDVLSQLLQGSGYNVLMIGDQGRGAPRQIVLTVRRSGDSQPAANNSQPNANEEDTEVEEQPPQQPPAPMRPGFGPGGPPRTPQQVMQEMQQRQEQMQRQQQQQPPPGDPLQK